MSRPHTTPSNAVHTDASDRAHAPAPGEVNRPGMSHADAGSGERQNPPHPAGHVRGHGDANREQGAAAPAPVAAFASGLVLEPQAQQALRADLAQRLQRKVHGLCFSPYLDGQGPGTVLQEEPIRQRLQHIAPHTRWVRSFSCTEGNEHIPKLAHSMGLKTLVGAWLGTDLEINARELAGVIAVAQAGHADMVAVGNEVLLREDLSEDALIACIEQVKAALPGIPVGYVDAYYLFELHPRVSAVCDVLLTNCYPFWEGYTLDQALPAMQSMVRRTQAVAAGKPVIVSETGWPDRGSPFGAAQPSPDAALRYFNDTFDWAEREGIDVFYFSAFDEAWKVGAEGDVGAFWGLWDKDGQAKFL
jgi:glucan 1,3-beta-glucosidase